MNKAFVKESEDETSPKCPACLAIGQPVGAATLRRHLVEGAGLHLAASSANFCPNPTCDVAYFDANRQTVNIDKLRSVMWPKSQSPAAILCPCLNVTAAHVFEDARRKDPARVRSIVNQSKAHPQRCAELNICGCPCVAEAQRLYLKNVGK